MFCSTLYLGAKAGQRFLSPFMCPSPGAPCSSMGQPRSVGSNQSLSGLREPKRKHGVCLATNPVIDKSLKSPDSAESGQYFARPPQTRMSNPGHINRDDGPLSTEFGQSTRSLQSCEFITFKGLSSSQYRKELERDQKAEMPQEVGKKTNEANGGATLVELPTLSLGLKKADQDGLTTINLANDIKGNQDRPAQQVVGAEGNSKDQTELSERGKYDDEPPFKFAGVIGCLLSTFFFSLSILCVKLIPNINSLQETAKICCFRGVFLTIACSVAIIYQKSTFIIKRDEIFLNFIRTFVGFFGPLGAYSALQYITVAESTALIYSSPVWTAILSYFVLREPFPPLLFLAIPFGFCGILLIARPDLLLGEWAIEGEVITELERHHHQLRVNNTMVTVQSHLAGALNKSDLYQPLADRTLGLIASYNMSSNLSALMEGDAILLDPNVETELYLEQRWPGMLISLGTSFIGAFVFIVLKFRKTTPIQTVTFYLGVGTIILSTILQCLIGFGSWPTTLIEWTLLFGMGINSWLGQALMQWSLQYEKASVLSIVKTLDVAMAFFWSAIFLDEDILWTSVTGAAIIVIIVGLLMANDLIARLCCSRCTKQ